MADAGYLRWIVEADTSKFDEEVDSAKKKVSELKEEISKADKTTGALKNTGKAAGVASEAFSQLAKTVGSVGFDMAKAGCIALTGALTGLAAKGIAGADSLAQYNAQVIALANTTEDANSAMGRAVDFFKNNPFNRFETFEAVKNLMMFDKSLANAENGSAKLGKTLDMLGTAALANGVSIAELADKYGSIAVASSVGVGEVDELAARIPSLWGAIAEKTGKSTAEVRDSILGVGIDAQIVRDAMRDMFAIDTKALKKDKEYLDSLTGAARQSAEAYLAFEKTMERQTNRVEGRLADMQAALAGYKVTPQGGFEAITGGIYEAVINLKMEFADLLASSEPLGKKMGEVFNRISTSIAPLIDKLTQSLEPILTTVINLFDKFSQVLEKNQAILIPVLGGALAMFGGLAKNIPIIGDGIASFSGKLKDIGGILLSFAKARPILAGVIAIFAVGFVNAIKTSEDFRNSIASIFRSITVIVQKVSKVFMTLVEVFMKIATSQAIVTVLEIVAGALELIAEALAAIPQDAMSALVTFVLTMKLMSVSPLLVYASGIMMLVAAIKNFITTSGGLKEAAVRIKNAFANLPDKLKTIGHNIMTGLVNGLAQGFRAVKDFCVKAGQSIVSTFKATLGIHSPSKVMAEMGGYITLGLANGIEDKKSVAQKAMENLATDVLESASKVIENKVDFDVIDVNGEYKDWKKVSKLFTVGSKQYSQAIEKMEQARKKLNLQIIDLQKNYNNTLDDTIKRVQTMYGLFDKPSLGAGKGSEAILTDLSEQVSAMQAYSAALTKIRGLDLDEGLIEELQSMGISAVDELQAISMMSQGEIDTLNSLYLQKQEIATNEAIKQTDKLKQETLDEISKLSDGIDGEVVKVSESGGRLISEISEGITGSLPTLEDAFSKMDEYMAEAARELGKDAGSGIGDGLDDAFNDSDLLGNISDELSGIDDGIMESIESLGRKLVPMLAGIVGGVALFKFGPKIINALTGGGLDTLARTLAGVKIPKASAGAEATKVVTESLTQAENIGNTVTKVSAGLTKGQQVCKTIAFALGDIALLAVDIALMAGAFWLTNKLLKEVDLGSLAAELGIMAGTIVALGGLAYVIGKFAWKEIAIGLVVIAGMALDVSFLAGALHKVDEAIQDPGSVLKKLGVMGLAVVEMGVLAGIIGAIMSTGVAALVVGVGLVTMLAMAGAYALIALELKAIELIDLDVNKVVAHVNLIKECIEKIGPNGGVLDNIKAAVSAFAEMIKTFEVMVIVKCYKEMAEDLSYIQDVELDTAAIITKVGLIKAVVETLGSDGSGSILDGIRGVVNTFIDATKTIAVGLIVETYANMAKNLDEIQNIEINKEKVLEKVKYLGEVCESVSQPVLDNGKSMWEALGDCVKMMTQAKAVESAGKILETYSTMGETLSSIQDITADLDGVKDKVDLLSQITQIIIDQKGDGGIFGKIGNFFTGSPITTEQVEKVKNIMAKMAELGEAANNMPAMSSKTLTDRVDTITSLISKISEIKDPGDLGTKEWIVGMATSIAYKLGEFQNALKTIGEEDGSVIVGNVIKTLNSLVTGIITSISDRLPAIEDVGRAIGGSLGSGLSSTVDKIKALAIDLFTSFKKEMEKHYPNAFDIGKELVAKIKGGIYDQKDTLVKAGEGVQSAFWRGLEDKLADEYSQGAALAGKVKSGIESVNFVETGVWAYKGFTNGVKGGMEAVYWAGQAIAAKFLQGIKDKGKQGSPWKTTFKSGAWAIEGLVDGIESEEDKVLRSAERLADGIIDTLDISDITVSPTLGTLGTMTPEMTDVRTSGVAGGNPIVINQTNQNYTQFSMEQLNRDLRWELSKV